MKVLLTTKDRKTDLFQVCEAAAVKFDSLTETYWVRPVEGGKELQVNPKGNSRLFSFIRASEFAMKAQIFYRLPITPERPE